MNVNSVSASFFAEVDFNCDGAPRRLRRLKRTLTTHTMLDFDGIMQVAQELKLPDPPDLDRKPDICGWPLAGRRVLSTDAAQARARITD